MTPTVLIGLEKARKAGRAVCLISSKSEGALGLIDEDGIGMEDTALAKAAQTALNTDHLQTLERGDEVYYIAPFNPPVTVYIVGAVHITQALLPMLDAMGFSSCVIDPRSAFANDARFHSAVVLNEWPDDVLEIRTIGRRSAVITLTHDPKLDDPALQVALKSAAFYIGALGSKRTHAKRLERLHAQGFTQEDMSRIAAPIGLNIGAQSPAEIAVAIAAQLVEALRGPKP